MLKSSFCINLRTVGVSSTTIAVNFRARIRSSAEFGLMHNIKGGDAVALAVAARTLREASDICSGGAERGLIAGLGRFRVRIV